MSEQAFQSVGMGTSEFDAEFQDVLVENAAQAVLKRFQRLSNTRDRYKYRWVWELLQNASDALRPRVPWRDEALKG